MKRLVVGFLFSLSLILAPSAFAQGSTVSAVNGGHVNGQHKVPSKLAINACEGKAAGDSCEMTTPKGAAKSGICAYTQDKKTLFCKHGHRKAQSQAKPQAPAVTK